MVVNIVERKEKPGLGGRPPYYSSPEEMQEVIDKYFDDADAKKWPYTIPDLALALGFTSRTSLLNYAGKPEFVDTIKRAKLRIEGQRARQLVQGSGIVAGQIFDLKNNFGWKDSQEKVISGAMNNVNIGLVGMPPEPKNIEEWEVWYERMIDTRKRERVENQAAIDVSTGGDA